MESMTLQSEKFKEKLTREKEKSVFEEQLREIDTEIFGKADMGGNVQMVSKVRILESEKMVSANREEKVASEEPVHGLGVGLLSSGPQDVMGLSKDLDGPAGKNTSLDQVIGKQCFQSGPKMPIANEGVLTRKAKSPNRKKPHTHACKFGKENVGKCTSNLQKANALTEITRMDTEKVEVGLKRKSRAPLEDVLENAGARKKPKLEEEVTTFGKFLATQMGSVAAAVQPRWEQ